MQERIGKNFEFANDVEVGELVGWIEKRMAEVGPQGANHDEFPILQNIYAILKSGPVTREKFLSFQKMVTDVNNKSSQYH